MTTVGGKNEFWITEKKNSHVWSDLHNGLVRAQLQILTEFF